MRNRTGASLTITAAMMLLSGTGYAGTVTWGSPTNIAGDSDVATNGTLVGAFNVGASGVAGTIVNGVNFLAMAATGSSVTVGNFTLANYDEASNSLGSGGPPFTNLSAAYQALLSSAAGRFDSGIFTLTIGGLSVGDTYLFELWSSASSTGGATLTAIAGNNVTLNPGGLGQFAIGTFTADATTELIQLDDGVPNYFDGFQLRDTATAPEPSSLGMFAVGALFLVRRLRQAA